MLQTLELTLPELLERYNSGKIPDSAVVQVTFDDENAGDMRYTDPLLELLTQWEVEDAAASPEQKAETERIYAEIEKNGIPRTRL